MVKRRMVSRCVRMAAFPLSVICTNVRGPPVALKPNRSLTKPSSASILMLLFRELLETLTASIRSVKVIRSTPNRASMMPTLAELDNAPEEVNFDRLKSAWVSLEGCFLFSVAGLLIASHKLLGRFVKRFDTCKKQYRRSKRKVNY